MPQLIINRSSEYTNALRNILIFLDGKEIGKIGNDESKTFDIPSGAHKLRAKIDWCSSNEIDINTADNDVTRINLSGTNPFLAMYYITFGRNKYLKLKQID